MKWGPNSSGVCFSTFQLKQEAIFFHGFPYIPANNLPLIAVKTSLLCRTIPQPIDLCFIAPILSNQMHSSSFLHFQLNLFSQAYLREALLEQHMRSHRGVKPFVCNECGLQFTVKSNWQRHVAEHTGTRWEICCMRRWFLIRRDATKRLTYFSCRRNYECEHCHKKFSRSYYLTDHLKVIHNRW